MNEYKQNINRAIAILSFGIMICLFLIFNSPEKFYSGVLYSVMGVITIIAYIGWDKF